MSTKERIAAGAPQNGCAKPSGVPDETTAQAAPTVAPADQAASGAVSAPRRNAVITAPRIAPDSAAQPSGAVDTPEVVRVASRLQTVTSRTAVMAPTTAPTATPAALGAACLERELGISRPPVRNGSRSS